MGPSGYIGDYSTIPEHELSETVKTRLNEDTNHILKECMCDVEELLKREKTIFERFAHELLVRQELEYDEIEAIFAEYGKANPRTFQAKKEGLEGAPESGNGPQQGN